MINYDDYRAIRVPIDKVGLIELVLCLPPENIYIKPSDCSNETTLKELHDAKTITPKKIKTWPIKPLPGKLEPL